MTVFSPLEVLNGLAKLNAEEGTGDHMFYRVYDDDGVLLGKTKISHHSGDIDDNLLHLMARQLKITLSLWKKIIDCSKGRSEYIDMVSHNA